MNTDLILRWTARLLLIAAILFMMLFSLDVFESEGSLGSKLTGLLIHNLPALALLAILILAWKKEFWGGILVIAATLGMMVFFHSFTSNKASLIVMMPFLIAGLLFLISHFRSHSGKISSEKE
ncbi:MAG TPA: hypothetical protein PLW67_06885 [Prolixibacteraceae bacterium]|nr:hypothetical protein [Prolixibacteraceae bacterium]